MPGHAGFWIMDSTWVGLFSQDRVFKQNSLMKNRRSGRISLQKRLAAIFAIEK